MRRVLLTATLLACAMRASGQNPSGIGSVTHSATMNSNRHTVRHATKTAEQPPTPVDVPPNTLVVTLKGVCDPAKKAELQGCQTVFTREQMDKIVTLVAPMTPEALRPQVVIKYVRMLAAAKLADGCRLGNNPTVAAELEKQTQLGRVQVLAKAIYRQMQDHAENPTIAELQQLRRTQVRISRR